MPLQWQIGILEYHADEVRAGLGRGDSGTRGRSEFGETPIGDDGDWSVNFADDDLSGASIGAVRY
jgi:hypothetical protein